MTTIISRKLLVRCINFHSQSKFSAARTLFACKIRILIFVASKSDDDSKSKTRNEFSRVILISGRKTNLHKTRRLVVKLEMRDNAKWHSEASTIKSARGKNGNVTIANKVGI